MIFIQITRFEIAFTMYGLRNVSSERTVTIDRIDDRHETTREISRRIPYNASSCGRTVVSIPRLHHLQLYDR